uniref:Ras-related protein Rab-3 n=1 Tax=Anopheles quadriannulatus TaxID=34691 RepID=A0A182X8H7_ANOQN
MNKANLYQQANGVQRRDAMEILKEYAPLISCPRDGEEVALLDIGCGSGDVLVDYILPVLSRGSTPVARAMATDISEQMVRHARESYRHVKTIEFDTLDIGIKLDSAKLSRWGQFSHVTSFYCLHWVQNQHVAFSNIYNLLQHGGDCLLVFLANNPIFDIYNQLSRSPKWSKYMYDVEKYISPYQYCENPASEIEDLLCTVGFQQYQIQVRDKLYVYEGLDNLKRAVLAVNPFSERMPPELQDRFLLDYIAVVRQMYLTKTGSEENDCNLQFISPYKLMAGGGDPKWQKDASDQNFDYMFKLLIIGNSSVGKTSFLFRYADDSFTSAFVSTVGIDFKVKTVFRHDKRVKLQIWDTAGQERYRTITTAYYRGAMGFILMYDITNEESFNSVQDWVTQIKTYSWDNAQVILVGNKCDMEDERVISFERGKQLADQLGVEFFETSAKENVHVTDVFERLVDIICDKMSESLDSDPTLVAGGPKGQRLTDQPGQGPPNANCNC